VKRRLEFHGHKRRVKKNIVKSANKHSKEEGRGVLPGSCGLLKRIGKGFFFSDETNIVLGTDSKFVSEKNKNKQTRRGGY